MASGICGSWGQIECSAHTSAVTGLVASFPSLSADVPGAAYTPMWLWVSISPGVTHFPVPSMTVALEGVVTLVPTAKISPSAMTTDAPRSSGPAAVSTVAFRITTGAEEWRS